MFCRLNTRKWRGERDRCTAPCSTVHYDSETIVERVGPIVCIHVLAPNGFFPPDRLFECFSTVTEMPRTLHLSWGPWICGLHAEERLSFRLFPAPDCENLSLIVPIFLADEKRVKVMTRCRQKVRNYQGHSRNET